MEHEPNETEKAIAAWLERRSQYFWDAHQNHRDKFDLAEISALRRISEEYSDAAEAVLNGNYRVMPFNTKESDQ